MTSRVPSDFYSIGISCLRGGELEAIHGPFPLSSDWSIDLPACPVLWPPGRCPKKTEGETPPLSFLFSLFCSFSEPPKAKAKVPRRKLEAPVVSAGCSLESGKQEWPERLGGSLRLRKPPRRSTEEHPSNMGASGSVEDLRIVMVGRTGNGKSATGNTILGREAFISKIQFRSVTTRCQKATCILPDGRTLAVIDTPGFFDTKHSQLETIQEVKKCVSFCSPGPHVIIHVLRLGYFSQEMMEVAKLIKDVFSLEAKEYMILLFTRKEDLEGRPLQELLAEECKCSAALRGLMESCGNWYLAFNNKAKGKERQDQVDELIQMVDDLKRKNWPKPYYPKEMLGADMINSAYSFLLGTPLEKWLLPRSSPWKLPRRLIEEHPSNMGAAESVEDLRIVMVGKTGNGKSATGNSILGREAKMEATSVTSLCKKAKGILPDGRILAVIDTPGFFDTKYTQLQTIEEVKKCVSFCSPGPHVIIQVIRLGHFSQEEMEVAKLIKDIFSLNAKEYMVLLFTRKEDLEGRSLQEVLSEDDKSLAALREQIKSCGNRCLAFNNKAEGKERQDQVDELIRMVEDLARKNWPKYYYTKEMLEEDKKKAPGWLCTLL